MVYITRWEDFETAAIELYKKSATKARYCVKFRPKDGELVLKITDDFKCLKFKTKSSIILNRFECLNLRLLLAMSNRAMPVATPTPQPPTITSTSNMATTAGLTEGTTGDVAMKDMSGTPAEGTAGGKTGGGKKKKKGKK